MPRNFNSYILSISIFLFPFSLKLFRCSHVQSIVSSLSSCRSTFLLLKVSFSSVRRLSSIHCYIGELILNDSSVVFIFPSFCFLFITKFTCFLILRFFFFKGIFGYFGGSSVFSVALSVLY